MNKILISPNKYVQGSGSINNLGEFLAVYGKKAMLIGGQRALHTVDNAIKNTFQTAGVDYIIHDFQGECSKSEINRLVEEVKKNNVDVVVGVGGGKAVDAAKACAYYAKLPVAIVPTIASTDAPCSALSVIYKDDGVFEEYLLLPSNPNLVLIDTAIVAEAPTRLFVAGMGDAMATWFEADACAKSGAYNISGGNSTMAALALAKLCYETLLDYGYQAVIAVDNNVVTEAVEKVVEANTLLSGIGFESSGLACAHSVHNGLTVLKETHGFLHGEKVAFGTLVQLVMENKSMEEITTVLSFCAEVGLPTTLSDIGVTDTSKDNIMKVAEATVKEGETMHNMPFKVDANKVYAAIMTANAIGMDFSGASTNKQCGCGCH